MKVQTNDPAVAAKIDAFIERSKAQGWSEDQIKAEIESKAKEQGWELNTQSGATGSFRSGASGEWLPQNQSGFARGFVKDPLAGLQQLATESEIVNLVNKDWANKKKNQILQDESQYQATRGADAGKLDMPRLVGNIINPVNMAIMAATKVPPAATLPQMAGYSAMQGGMMSGLAPVYEGTREGQAALGVGGGIVAAPVAKTMARITKPKVSDSVALLRKEGVVPTVGQSFGGAIQKLEDKLTGLPILGDAITNARQGGMKQYQVAAFNRALKPIGEKASGKIGHAGVQEVRTKLQTAYDDLLPKMNFQPDSTFVQESSNLRNLVSSLPKEDQQIYDDVINKVITRGTPQGNMSGSTFKNVESSLTEEIRRLAQDPRYEKQQLASALSEYRDLMKQGLSRSNPMYAKRLEDINEGWRNYAVIRRAASGPQAAQTGTFTPSQLMQGVQESAKRQGKAAGRATLSEGRATMQDLATAGHEVLPSKYPDSGTVGRGIADLAVLGAASGNWAFAPHAAKAAAGLGTMSIPYLPGVRSATDLLLNARPNSAGLIADEIRKYPGLFAPVFPALIED